MPSAAPLRKLSATRSAPSRINFDTVLGRATLQAAAVIGFFAVWEIGVRAGWISAFLVGSPLGIFTLAFKMIASGQLLSDTWYTLFEAILGFVIGTIVGSLLALSVITGSRMGLPSSIASFTRRLKPAMLRTPSAAIS